jgi:2-(1,2-epoxy-1,2-dihydrophenyl)acetyl-CoA isomerase
VSEPVLFSLNEGVGVIRLNRPEAFNAFGREMLERLAGVLATWTTNDAVRAVVLTGEGKAFCAGGDLKAILSAQGGPGAGFHALAGRFHEAVIEIRRMPKPVIAAVNGIAAGGGFSLALACDFRVMARSAVLRQAYSSNGLSLDGGGSFMLPRLVGLARALEIVAFDAPIGAEQALACGMATKVVEDGAALEAATALAGELVHKSVNAFGTAKRLMTDAFDTPFETQLEHERAALAACARHPEGAEGLKAFSEKRKARFCI